MKKIIYFICVLLSLLLPINCYAMGSDAFSAYRINNAGKWFTASECNDIPDAFDKAVDGDIIEFIKDFTFNDTITAKSNILVTSGIKRTSNIIIGKSVALNSDAKQEVNNLNIVDNGVDHLIRFKNITVNGEYILNTGDINSNGAIDILDLVLLKKGLGNTSNYSVLRDVNLNGKVDSSDLIVLINIMFNKY